MRGDRFYLRHMLGCIERVEKYTGGGREEFFQSTLIQDAAMRNLQIMCESSGRVSEAMKSAIPNTRWRDIRRFRDVLAHAYLSIDLNRVWTDVENDLPTLKTDLSILLAESGAAS